MTLNNTRIFFFLHEQMCYWESERVLTAATGQQAWPDGRPVLCCWAALLCRWLWSRDGANRLVSPRAHGRPNTLSEVCVTASAPPSKLCWMLCVEGQSLDLLPFSFSQLPAGLESFPAPEGRACNPLPEYAARGWGQQAIFFLLLN